MCGRYTQTKVLEKLRKRFGDRLQLEFSPEGFVIRFNIAPSQDAPVILNNEQPTMSMLRWGLVPFWAKDDKIGYKMINSMGETVAEKPSFRGAFKKRRCLALADGFFEWKKTEAGKLPHWFTMTDREPFAFAGLWESWRRSDDSELRTFTIITTEPNELVRACHNRMPVILRPEDYDAWLDPKFQDSDRLKGMLKPFPADTMSATVVSSWVSNARNEGARCIEPASGGLL